jgi:hypothetical protein
MTAMTLAHCYAKRAVKTEWQRQGIKLAHVEAYKISQAADAYLTAHPELIALATERYRSFVESGYLKPPRNRRKPSQ